MRFALICMAFFATTATTGTAEVRETLHSGEIWSLHSVAGLTLQVEDGIRQRFDGACVLEGVVSLDNGAVASTDDRRTEGVLSVTILPSSITDGLPELRGVVWVEMTGGVFDFPDRVDGASLSTLNGFYGAPDASYADSVLTFIVEDAGRFREFLASGTAGEVVFVRDYRGKTLMRFPTSGLAAVREQFWECAGF